MVECIGALQEGHDRIVAMMAKGTKRIDNEVATKTMRWLQQHNNERDDNDKTLRGGGGNDD